LLRRRGVSSSPLNRGAHPATSGVRRTRTSSENARFDSYALSRDVHEPPPKRRDCTAKAQEGDHAMADPDKLRQFMMKMVGDLGAAVSVPLVRTGMRLGLYKAMDGAGPITSAALAEKAGISERYAREWLAQNAASGYLTYEPSAKTFELPPEQAMAFAREDSYVYIGGTIETVCAIYPMQPKVDRCVRSTTRPN
jgi:hypothetical protein